MSDELVSHFMSDELVSHLVRWCFKPSQPQRSIIIRAEGDFHEEIHS